jgi:hypothetical protein
VIVTSRPDPNTFVGWSAFTELKVVPLTKPKCLELIVRLKYDENVKKAFADAVEHRLFNTHRSFLSNPLLTTLMLMTYEQFGNIDDRMHVFYSQAFDTLFSKHDATKVGFRRHMNCRLSGDEFRSVLAAVCIQTYLRSELTFDAERALELIEAAKAISTVRATFDSSAFLRDLSVSLSFLVQDGLELTFAHRSFQEYFAARFILRSGGRRRELMRRLERRLVSDDVAGLAFDMDQVVFEGEFLLDRLMGLRKRLRYKDGDSISNLFVRLLKIDASVLMARRDASWTIRGVSQIVNDLDLVVFVSRKYSRAERKVSPIEGALFAAVTALRVDKGGGIDATEGELTLTDAEMVHPTVVSVLQQSAVFDGLGIAIPLYDDIGKRHSAHLDAIDAVLLEPDSRVKPMLE